MISRKYMLSSVLLESGQFEADNFGSLGGLI